jgi:hypothetical protein
MNLNKNSMKVDAKNLIKYIFSNINPNDFKIFSRVIYPPLLVFQKKEKFDVKEKKNSFSKLVNLFYYSTSKF